MTKKAKWIMLGSWLFFMSIYFLTLTPFMIVTVSVIFSIVALLFLRYLRKLISKGPLDRVFRRIFLISYSVIFCIFMGLYSYMSYEAFHYTEYAEVNGKTYVAVPTTGWKNQYALKRANYFIIPSNTLYAKSCTLSFTLESIKEGECKIEKYYKGVFKDPAQIFNEFKQEMDNPKNIDTKSKDIESNSNNDNLTPPKNEDNNQDNHNEPDQEKISVEESFTNLEVYNNEKKLFETLPGEPYFKNSERAVVNMGKAGTTDMVGIFSSTEDGIWNLRGYVPNSRGVFNFYEADETYFIFSYNVDDDLITFNFSNDGGMTWKLTQIEPIERRNYAVTSLTVIDGELCITTGTDPWSIQKIPESTYCSDDHGKTWR